MNSMEDLSLFKREKSKIRHADYNSTLNPSNRSILLSGMLRTTSFFGRKVDGIDGEGYRGQSSNLSSLDKYTGPSEKCASQIISSLRLYILVKASGLSKTFSCPGKCSFMPSTALVP